MLVVQLSLENLCLLALLLSVQLNCAVKVHEFSGSSRKREAWRKPCQRVSVSARGSSVRDLRGL